LCLVTDAFGGYGGIAQYNRDLIGALATVPRMARVQVLPRLAPGEVEVLPHGVEQVLPVPGRVRYAASALRAARRLRPTVIFNGHLYHGPLALRLSRMLGAKLVSQLHGTEIWPELRPHHREALEQSDLILAVSRDTRARVLAKTRVDPERVVVLNNTVGRDFSPGDRAAARAKFALGGEFVVLTVARLDAREGYKGHDRIIPLVARLRQDGMDVRYLVCGIGDDQPRLEGLAARHGITEHVRFLGKVPRCDLPDLYRAADLFALPSRGEGFGIAFLEAMASGTPAIGLAVGGAPDALGDGVLGLCVADEDFEPSFERAVRGVRGEPDGLWRAVQARFGGDQFRERAVRIFQQLDQA
jgi:phosphatidylinositol alpha-1,6-mannosyltransferase